MTITRLRPLLLLSLLATLLLSLGLKMGQRDTFILAVAMAIVLTLVVVNYSRWLLPKRLPMTDVVGQDPWRIRERVAALSERARLPMPQVHRLPWSEPQALVLGARPSTSTIVITDGLLERLSPDEVQAVLAYLVACIHLQANLAFTVGGALSDLLLAITRMIGRAVGWVFGTEKSLTSLVAPLAGACLRLSVGRRDYLAADRLAASWIKDPAILARALWKLDSYASSTPLDVNPATAPFYVVYPLTTRSWTRYFRTHPAIKDRIQNLMGYYPL